MKIPRIPRRRRPAGDGVRSGEAARAAKLIGRVLTAALIALPAVPVAVGLTLGAGSVSVARSASRYAPAKGIAGKPQTTDLPPGTGALVATVRRATELRVSPGGRALARVKTRTEFGSPAVLWVVTHTPGWLGVVSPQAGNGRLGWISQSDATLSRVGLEIDVSLSAHRVTVLSNGQVIHQYSAAVGQPSSPTPTGRFAVTDLLTTGDPTGPYGCCIVALSAYAPHAIANWTGGNRVAIHSTPDTASIGQSASHGCVRVSLADGRWLLDHVPLGTPTVIRS